MQNRTVVQESIEDKLRESLGQSGIIVVSFAIENLDFEDGFEEAIRAKVVAEQEALKMQNKTKEKEELELLKEDVQDYSEVGGICTIVGNQPNQLPWPTRNRV